MSEDKEYILKLSRDKLDILDFDIKTLRKKLQEESSRLDISAGKLVTKEESIDLSFYNILSNKLLGYEEKRFKLLQQIIWEEKIYE